MSDAAAPPPTTVAGRYELVREIAEGGMAVVYEARHAWTHRHVALKRMTPADSADERLRARFLREARTAARLTHPNVVTVLDMGEDRDGALFIVYELLVGHSLEELKRERGRMTAHEAFAILSPVMEALSHAHELGVIHRDVKPANIVLTETPGSSRVPKLVDFGVAKEVAAPTLSRLTSTGMVVGTPYYMSPEQISGDIALDGRADVWSMGVTLYELVAGHRPFEGAGVPQLLAAIVEGQPRPLDEVAPGTPAGLHDVLLRCFATDRNDRVADMREMQNAVRSSLWAGNLTPGALLSRRAERASVPESEGLETEIDSPLDLSELVEDDGTEGLAEAEAEATLRGRLPGALTLSFRVGHVAGQTRADAKEVTEAFEAALDARCEVFRYMHYAELVDALAENDVDLAWLPPAAYARAQQRGMAELLLTLERSGDLYYACALLGRRGVVGSYADLPGRSAVWVDAWAAAGYLVPRAMLRARGLDPDAAFSSQGFVGSYPAALDAVATGRADVTAAHCGVDEFGVIVRAAWDAAHPVEVLDVSDPIPGDTICCRVGLDAKRRQRAVRRLTDRQKARSVLRLTGATRMRPGDASAYSRFLEALEAEMPPSR